MIVVTGANGFLGSYLVGTLINKGYDVLALKRKESSLTEFNQIIVNYFNFKNDELNQVKWKDVDLLDVFELENAFKNAEMVFHCAAKVSFSKKDKKDLMISNFECTKNVVNTCLRLNVKKLIHVSSTAAIGRDNLGKIITENNQWEENDNNTAYADSKHLAELEVWRGIEEGLNAVIINPSIILGYGNWEKGSSNLFKKTWHGFSFYTKGNNAFVGVHDVAKIMVELANSSIQSERFLIISENLSYQTLFKHIAQYFKTKAPHLEIKSSYLKWISILLPIYNLFKKDSTLTLETIKTSVNNFEYSNKKIKNAIKFEFEPIEQVIKNACVLYSNHEINN